MSALLGLFGLKMPAWLCELLAAGVACLVLSLWWTHHNHALIQQGVKQQQDADNSAAADLKTKTDAKTAALAAAVTAQETARAKAESDLADYRRTHPLDAGALRVCNPAHDSGGGLPAAAGAHGSGSQASPAAGVGQSVLAGDSPGAADRLRLLDAFGALFDDTDRQVDGLQTRLGIKTGTR